MNVPAGNSRLTFPEGCRPLGRAARRYVWGTVASEWIMSIGPCWRWFRGGARGTRDSRRQREQSAPRLPAHAH